jgi:hypothetical protein
MSFGHIQAHFGLVALKTHDIRSVLAATATALSFCQSTLYIDYRSFRGRHIDVFEALGSLYGYLANVCPRADVVPLLPPLHDLGLSLQRQEQGKLLIGIHSFINVRCRCPCTAYSVIFKAPNVYELWQRSCSAHARQS